MNWQQHAAALARTAAHPASTWYGPLATVPRHVFVPHWYTSTPEGWTVHDGPADPEAWMDAAYADTTLVTRVGPLHADHAPADKPVTGVPTSSSTLPGLVVQMLRHARITDGTHLLDVATGSGYSAALACCRLGDRSVTTLDVDPYLTEAAADRLSRIGLQPHAVTSDASAPLPGQFDRIVSMVSMPTIPASWLTGLRPGGRLVTTIANTALIITADKTDDGGAAGRVEWDRASFMATRAGDDYPPALGDLFTAVRDRDGDTVTTSPYPVLDVTRAWELWSMLSVTVPGIEHRMQYHDDGGVTAWMLHPDGSWSRAHTPADRATTTVHQGGPRPLWDELDAIRRHWLHHGELPIYGARVTIDPDGTTHLTRGNWTTTL